MQANNNVERSSEKLHEILISMNYDVPTCQPDAIQSSYGIT